MRTGCEDLSFWAILFSAPFSRPIRDLTATSHADPSLKAWATFGSPSGTRKKCNISAINTETGKERYHANQNPNADWMDPVVGTEHRRSRIAVMVRQACCSIAVLVVIQSVGATESRLAVARL